MLPIGVLCIAMLGIEDSALVTQHAEVPHMAVLHPTEQSMTAALIMKESSTRGRKSRSSFQMDTKMEPRYCETLPQVSFGPPCVLWL
jgi:hypothetical protein